MKAYLTRYALSAGIEEVDCEPNEKFPDMIELTSINGRPVTGGRYVHGKDRDWHLDRTAALQRAEAMRASKIKSLQKQLQKLEALRFA